MSTLARDVVHLVAELAEIDESEVLPDRALRELGVDSLMVLEIVAFIEKATCTTVGEEDIKGVKTVSDLIARAERAAASVGS